MSTAPPHDPQPARHTRRIDPPRTRDERSQRTRELLDRVVATDDPAFRAELLDEVVVINLPVAEAVASRYRNRGVSDDDLRQAACEGLVKAVHKFDPAVRPDLLTYAVPTIRGEVQRYFRDRSWVVRPPRRVQELQWRISRCADELSQDLGRDPTRAEIGTRLGCTEREVDEAFAGFGCFRPISLDRPASGPGGATLGELVGGGEDAERSSLEARLTLAPLVQELSERDRRILYLRFFEDQSQSQIGDQLGVTQMQVSRLLEKIFTRLRTQLA